MKSVLAKHLKTAIHSRLRQEYPDFEKFSNELGGIVYISRTRISPAFAFIFLWPHTTMDGFTMELAANSLERYPLEILPKDLAPGLPVRVRIGSLVRQTSLSSLPDARNGWWMLNESDKLNIQKIVESSSNHQVESGLKQIPWMAECAMSALKVCMPVFTKSVMLPR